jgi:hypothetical protein
MDVDIARGKGGMIVDTVIGLFDAGSYITLIFLKDCE